jgi:fibronectin type III domain protein
MAAFSRKELEIIRLAHDIATGLTANKDAYSAPPVGPDQGLKLIDAFYQARDGAMTKAAAARDGVAEQHKALADIVEWARTEIHYAEGMYRKDPAKLGLISWGARRPPAPATVPGQAGSLLVQHEGKNSVSLSWRDPVDGGSVLAYKIQRRKIGTTDWTDVGTAVNSEVTLNNQEGGAELEYQVLAVNKVGDGPASNVVRVVL